MSIKCHNRNKCIHHTTCISQNFGIVCCIVGIFLKIWIADFALSNFPIVLSSSLSASNHYPSAPLNSFNPFYILFLPSATLYTHLLAYHELALTAPSYQLWSQFLQIQNDIHFNSPALAYNLKLSEASYLSSQWLSK